MRLNHRAFALPVAFAALIVATLVGAPSRAFAKPLVVCTEASPDGFDVVRYNSLTTSNASGDVVFDQLVRYDATTGKLEPSLASSWEVSPDGLTVTFHLRPNV